MDIEISTNRLQEITAAAEAAGTSPEVMATMISSELLLRVLDRMEILGETILQITGEQT